MTTHSEHDKLSEPCQQIVRRSAEMMNGIRYTFKTHYKMAEFYEKAGRVADFLVAIGTAALAVFLIWDVLSQQGLVTLALFVAIVSWSQAVLKLGEKSQKHYAAGNRYHILFEEFDTFIKIEVPDDTIPIDEKKAKFNSLSEDRDRLNELTPRTTNFWYNQVSESEANAIAGNDEEEVRELAGIELSG